MLRAMLIRLLRRSSFRDLLQLLSPSAIGVFGSARIFEVATELRRNRRDDDLWRNAEEHLRYLLSREALAIDYVQRASSQGEHAAARYGPMTTQSDVDERSPPLDPGMRGAQVLRLYFAQLLASGPILLDLRAETFSPKSDCLRPSGVGEMARLQWSPKRLCFCLDEGFRSAVVAVYRGHYAGDAAEFRAGLADLSLSHAEDLFRQHFGMDTSAVRFSLVEFHKSFQHIFASCVEAKAKLHPHFVVLGIYLALLYEHLEKLGGSFDVRAAWQAQSKASIV